MITNLRLKNFKSFQDAEITLGPFTLLVGTNASGKSNVRDAFRFLHGIGRGYSLADIFGEKIGEGGERVWSGIRGGVREAFFQNETEFTIEAEFSPPPSLSYSITVSKGTGDGIPIVLRETLRNLQTDQIVFDLQNENTSSPNALGKVTVYGAAIHPQKYSWNCSLPVITMVQLGFHETDNSHSFNVNKEILDITSIPLRCISNISIFDPDPLAMREPSMPGQISLGPRGERLSSVLLNIVSNPSKKQAIQSWLPALVPADVTDIKFEAGLRGEIQIYLQDNASRAMSADSISDGTLRFLSLIAALFQPSQYSIYSKGDAGDLKNYSFLFLDEMDTGVHPTRLPLLMQLIERQTKDNGKQVFGTTHSPQMLQAVKPEYMAYIHLAYRLSNHSETRIKAILDIPDAKRLMDEYGLRSLHDSGWMENAVEFDGDLEPVP